MHVKDDTGAGAGGVAISAAGQNKKTDKSGFVAFDALPADSYTAGLGPLTGAYDPPPETSKSTQVQNGGVKVLSFTLRRRAKLKVKVVQKGAPSNVLEKADVTVTGDESPPAGKTKAGNGIADFGSVKAGDYFISVALSTKDAENFKAPTDPVEVKLAPGDDKT
ncbi:MAG: hypothetical protein ACRD2G_03115, partial [Terriglobia bacterium]